MAAGDRSAAEGIRARARLQADEAVAKSQDSLFTAVEGMDKAVLVELCVSLSEMTQSIYFDREKSRQDQQAWLQRLRTR